MKIKSRHELLNDIIKDSKKYPDGWKAAFGKNTAQFANDFYFFHQECGIYLLKEYQKNPYQVKGLGSKIARNIDNDIEERISSTKNDFGIITGNIQKIVRNINNGIPPHTIFEEGLKGRDLGIQIPVRGKASHSETTYKLLKETYKSNQKKLDKHFEKIVTDEGVYASYR